jgi:hypothetical protein
MGHLKGSCQDSCYADKRNCYHNITCKILKQFTSGKWLIENPSGYVRGVESYEMIFNDGEYHQFHNPNALTDFPDSTPTRYTTQSEKKDFNTTLKLLKKQVENEISQPVKSINGSVDGVDHWSDTEKVWHTKDCEVINR